ncbi:MAG: type II toxin-antitoxin system VapC family toxin [Candidatus Eremiobacteraeota bacterium]|nr:type II toxin-antitoxin system VapC family toxin [Candidatus Eremiobacteraeota bacterium]
MTRLLLDTCTFLWLVSDNSALSETARKCFATPNNEVYLSTASVWEILVKHRLGKLPLPSPPGKFVATQREAHAISSLSIDEHSVCQLPKLPAFHKDPFDRILICQAIAHGLVILTPDAEIAQYPVRTTW